MSSRVYPIDWRDEFAQLAPYLGGSGGVIRVRYPGQRCAPSAFLSTLKSEYECKDDGSSWVSIRIDHAVYSVRYLSGIRDEFVRKMQVELPRPDNAGEAPASLDIFADVNVGGDINANISNITQNNYISGDNAALLSRNRDKWIRELCDRLERFLGDCHIMVIINHGNHADQDEFWRFIWQDRLEKLDKLLLVHMFDVADEGGVIHDLAPAPCLEFELPTALTPRTQQHAVEDLAQIIVRKFPKMSSAEAQVRADTLVRTHINNIARLHRQYAALEMQLGRAAG